ncbi:MAG TPA: glutamyl-tRNA reductase [Longimicrobiales bacterium]|nr:glutamyl-tRNA reductase [Longimicrobiales bacterium]
MPRSELLLLGTSYQTAPGSIRELAVEWLPELRSLTHRLTASRRLVEEAAVLTTCGRVELYVVSPAPERARRVLARATLNLPGRIPIERSHLYEGRGRDVARHLFRVASGLDSAVQGEAEILGQVRGALACPENSETLGPTLTRLFQAAVSSGKRVRSETGIGRGGASLAGAALGLLRSRIGSLENRSALVLGAGETGSLMAQLLAKAGARVTVANRTVSRARALARTVAGEAIPLDAVEDMIPRVDIVVGAVARRPGLVSAEVLGGSRPPGAPPLWFLDLAHPRNVEPHVRDLPGVSVLDLERVEDSVRAARAARAEHVPEAEAIVEAEVDHFIRWHDGRAAVPHLKQLRQHVLTTARTEVDRFARGLGDAERTRLERFARSLTRTLLHHPTVVLREADPGTEEGRQLLELTRLVFGLPRDGTDPGGLRESA